VSALNKPPAPSGIDGLSPADAVRLCRLLGRVLVPRVVIWEHAIPEKHRAEDRLVVAEAVPLALDSEPDADGWWQSTLRIQWPLGFKRPADNPIPPAFGPHDGDLDFIGETVGWSAAIPYRFRIRFDDDDEVPFLETHVPETNYTMASLGGESYNSCLDWVISVSLSKARGEWKSSPHPLAEGF
jgi:hypothetical protein